MDWVEVQGKSVDLAVEVALSELGVASRDDVQVEVLEDAKPGFLGMGGREAIVKVTRTQQKRRRRGRGRGSKPSNQSSNGNQSNQAQNKQSTSNRSKSKPSERKNGDKRRQEKKVSQPNQDNQSSSRDDRPEQAPIEEQAEVAAGFIKGLLDAFGLEGEVTTRIEEGVLYLNVEGEQTEALIGPKGSVMQSVLELARTVVQRKTYGAPRMRIDIAGYGERRREALKIYAVKLATQVVEDQDEVMLEPMNAGDRKVVHDAVSDIDEVRSYSEGDEPRRSVVLAYTDQN